MSGSALPGDPAVTYAIRCLKLAWASDVQYSTADASIRLFETSPFRSKYHSMVTAQAP